MTEFYGIFRLAHSWWAATVLVVLLVAIINALAGFLTKNREYKSFDLRLSLFGLIATHIQLLLALLLAAARASMPNFPIAHTLTAVLGIVAVTMGWSIHKRRKTAKGVFGAIAFFYFIGFLLIFSRAPWAYWVSLFKS